MDFDLLWRSALTQLIAVGLVFAVLLAAPLPDDFFRDYGAVIGPVSWAACSLVTGRVMSLGLGTTLLAALAGGAAAAMVGALASHSVGLVVGVALVAAIAATRGRAAPRARSPAVRAG